MGSNNIIIREYLESLKEDGELDYLFPILLNLMGFRIIVTAKESKGQSQYGKDIVAIGKDSQGVDHRYYFELKGYKDKDINERNFSASDGIRESIIEAKDTAFTDSSIPNFNHLPIKVVLVHNGVLKTNLRPTFQGFISSLFEDNQFERWDIYYLTDLFSEHLFNEYLLTDEESLKLFKKTLVLLDAPHNDYRDFINLVDLQVLKIGSIQKGRALSKFFATQNLLAHVIIRYSTDNNNLEAAKQCLTYLLLKTWAWVLRNNLEHKPAIINAFSKLVNSHFHLLDLYFQRTLPTAQLEDGLFAENGGPFEEVGYPLRCFEYLNYLVYFFEARQHYPTFLKEPTDLKRKALRKRQKECLKQLIRNNDGCQRPILDYHSISILNVLLFLIDKNDYQNDDLEFVSEYLSNTIENILIINTTRNRFPFLGGELEYVKQLKLENKRTDSKALPSSLLITILFEFVSLFDFGHIYEAFSKGFDKKVNLQTAHPHFSEFNIEQLLFEKHFEPEFYVETDIELKSSLEEFKTDMQERVFESSEYRTDKAGFPFLRKLAHIYFKNEFFVDEWRKKLSI